MLWKRIGILFGLLLLLTACSGETIEEKIHTHLEEAVILEQDFEAQQSEITELEKKEQEIYAEIIELGAEELDEITRLSEEALEIIEARGEKLEIEQQSIESAKAEFKEIESLLENLEDEAVREKGEAMYEMMMDRYTTYEKLYEAYKESLALETELYILLQEDEIEQEDLSEQIEKINTSYEAILAENDAFNEQTNKYNELKQEFYNEANMEVISES